MAPQDFRTLRWLRLLNASIQIALVLTLFMGLTHVASQHFIRHDFTRQHRFSLSPETLSYLEQLETTVRVIVTIPSESDNAELNQLYEDVRFLLREYDYATRSNPEGGIEVEFVDVFQQRRRAQLLADQYGLDQPNLVLFLAGERQRIVFPDEFYGMKDWQRDTFLGEKIVTSAILDVSAERAHRLYFLTGHGEMRLDDVNPQRGLSELAATLRQRNLQLASLDLSAVERVPSDADLLLLVSPQTPVLPQEREILRHYLANEAGRLVVFLDPGRRHGLDELFSDWGIIVDDVLLLDTGPDFHVSGGDLLLRRFSNRHSITRTLWEHNLPVVAGFSRSVRPDEGRPLDESLVIESLVETSSTSWGERGYQSGRNLQYDEGVDLPGPLSVGVVSERQLASHLGINLPGGRLIVFGNSDFISNQRIASAGNLTLMLNTINWTLDRDRQVNIPPRPIERLQLALSQDEIRQLRLAILLILPSLAALTGIAIYWIRRK